METEMIELEVNGVAVSVPKGSNLLVAAKAANIKIPYFTVSASAFSAT